MPHLSLSAKLFFQQQEVRTLAKTRKPGEQSLGAALNIRGSASDQSIRLEESSAKDIWINDVRIK